MTQLKGATDSGSSNGVKQMTNLVVMEKKVARGTLTRIIDRFESTNPIKEQYSGVIKNYVYVDQKKVLV